MPFGVRKKAAKPPVFKVKQGVPVRVPMARYEEATFWLAHNDCWDATTIRDLSESVTLLLVADLFHLNPRVVAKDVLALRRIIAKRR